MKSCLLAAAAAVLSASGSTAASREVIYQGDLAPLNITPTFDHGYVIVWDRNIDGDTSLKRISVYAPSGVLAFRTNIQAPGHPYLSLSNGAVDTDGSVAVVFREPGGFTLLDKGGQQTRTVLTGAYVPTQICFAADHTIWLAGSVFGSQDYGILRRYSLDGKQLGEFLPRSVYDLSPAQSIGGNALRAANDRIVTLLERASDSGGPPTMEWFELDLAGNVIGRPGTHRFFFPWALTPDGTIYAREGGSQLLVFDRAAGAWKVSTLIRPANGRLAGADENGLVYGLPQGTYTWVPTK